MEYYNIHSAKTNLSKLVEKALQGEDIIIARDGTPAVRITPCTESLKRATHRQGGQWTGKIWFSPDYEESDALVQKMFGESELFPKE